MSCLFLGLHFGEEGQLHLSQGLVEKHSRSADLEIQARSCEYGCLFRFETIRPQLLEPMPALDEATYMARFNAPAVVAAGPTLTVVRLHERALSSPLSAGASRTKQSLMCSRWRTQAES